MESVYFYSEEISKDINDVLKNDDFTFFNQMVIESNIIHSGQIGYIIYINANPEEISNIEYKFKELGAEKLKGEEEKTVIDTIRAANDDWDMIEEDCRCEYEGISKGHCKNSFTIKCYECRHNEKNTGILQERTKSYYEIDI